MSKRKNKDPGRVRQAHPQQSFKEMVADATLARLSGYIDNEIEGAAQAILARQQNAMANLLTRLVATEEILSEKLGVTKVELAERVANIQDRAEGYENITDRGAQQDDRVRIEIKTKTEDQVDFAGSSRLQIDNTGSGSTLGKELEAGILGMAVGETREVKFGKDGSMAASITLNKISARPKQEAAPQAEETPSEAAPQETPNASADVGQ